MSNTFGTWLPGDARGWRERNHRHHVDGDYKNPPPKGSGEKILACSKSGMQRAVVRLEPMLRKIAIDALVQCLIDDHITVLIASLDSHHLHLLARFPDNRPRRKLGWGKLSATKAVKNHLRTLNDPSLLLENREGIWSKRSKAEPIKDRGHLVRALNYIRKHQSRGSILYVDPALQNNRDQRVRKQQLSAKQLTRNRG
jgi:REP element-mobilizing transposase RayT